MKTLHALRDAQDEGAQSLSVLHRIREALIRERTRGNDQTHAFLLGFGIPHTGLATMKRLPSAPREHPLPSQLMVFLRRCHRHVLALDEQIKTLYMQLAEVNLGSRLHSIPCVNPITASLLAVGMGDGRQYANSRDFAVSLGLEPRQYGTGYQNHLPALSKRGDKLLWRLLVQCPQGRPDAIGPSARSGADLARAAPLERGGLRLGHQAAPDCLSDCRRALPT